MTPPLAHRLGKTARLAAIGCVMVMTASCGTSGDGLAAAAAQSISDIPISGTMVFPENITADAAGNLYNSSNNGTIYRVVPGGTRAEPWVLPDDENGLQSLLGVLADNSRGVVWACSNPNMFASPPQQGASALKAFDYGNGILQASYAFPLGSPAACNDIAVAANGTVYVTETASGRLFSLANGADELTLFANGEELVGVDGIAFAQDGTMYINNVRANLIQRVNRDENGAYAGLTDLKLSEPVNGPDGIRPIGGNKFLQAEGPGGRVALITIEGDNATVTPIKTGLESSPGVTRIGSVGYAVEGKIGYLFDPALQGQDPGQFVIRAFPLPEGL